MTGMIPIFQFVRGVLVWSGLHPDTHNLFPNFENNLKNNKFYHKPSDNEYFKECIKYIDIKYLRML
jgi:hypothetical protein